MELVQKAGNLKAVSVLVSIFVLRCVEVDLVTTTSFGLISLSLLYPVKLRYVAMIKLRY